MIGVPVGRYWQVRGLAMKPPTSQKGKKNAEGSMQAKDIQSLECALLSRYSRYTTRDSG
jgi:hypothetical protein